MASHFLVVEDNATNQLVIKTMLAKAGYPVDIAVNGKEGVEKARQTRYDMILMDLSMPVMGGVEATELIRNGEGPNRRTPIVALTANAFDENRRQCLEAGMSGFLTKPISMASLKEEIEKQLQSGAAAERVTKTENPLPDRATARIIDYQVLERLKNETSASLFPDLLSVFLEQGAKRIERIEQAISTEDFTSLRSEIHSLKSESAVFGAEELTECVTHIDLLCNQNETEQVFSQAKAIKELWSRVNSALQNLND